MPTTERPRNFIVSLTISKCSGKYRGRHSPTSGASERSKSPQILNGNIFLQNTIAVWVCTFDRAITDWRIVECDGAAIAFGVFFVWW